MLEHKQAEHVEGGMGEHADVFGAGGEELELLGEAGGGVAYGYPDGTNGFVVRSATWAGYAADGYAEAGVVELEHSV